MSSKYLSARLDELRDKIIDSITSFTNQLTKDIEDLFESLKQLPLDDPATEKQRMFIKELSKKLCKPLPPDLDLLTKNEASKLIDSLLKELRRRDK